MCLIFKRACSSETGSHEYHFIFEVRSSVNLLNAKVDIEKMYYVLNSEHLKQ